MITHKTHSENKQKSTVSPFIFMLLIKCASIFKVSFIVGSYLAFFSATAIISPLAGAFMSIFNMCLVFAFGLTAKVIIAGALPSFKFLAYIIPGFFASLYWSSPSALIRVLVPLACMAAFIAHPAIGAGWVYSLYWFIPVALYFSRKQTVFLQSLGSTFTAHAVGSVIWLYALPMTPAVWLGLIPVAFVERMIFATGMVIAYHVINYAVQSSRQVSLVAFKKHLA